MNCPGCGGEAVIKYKSGARKLDCGSDCDADGHMGYQSPECTKIERDRLREELDLRKALIYDDIFDGISDAMAAAEMQWGGPDHDDTHTEAEWQKFIIDHANRLVTSVSGSQVAPGARGIVFHVPIVNPAPDYRQRLMKIAALAIDAAKSYDRRAENKTAQGASSK